MKKIILIATIILLTIYLSFDYQDTIQEKTIVHILKILDRNEPDKKTTNDSLDELVEPKYIKNEVVINTVVPRKYNCPPIYDEQTEEDFNKQLETTFTEQGTTEVRKMSAITGFLGNIEKMRSGNLDTEELSRIQIDKLRQLTKKYPSDKLINYHFLNACAANIDNVNCSEDNLKRAIKVDNSNGFIWGIIANIYLSKSNIEKAIDALERSASAPLFEDFRSQRISLFTNALRQSGILKIQALMTAIGFDAAIALNGITEIIQFCNQNDGKTREDIAQVCLNYGKRLERDGGTMLSHGIGLSLQKIVHKLLNDDVSLNKVEIKRNNFNKALSEVYTDPDLFTYDESFQDYWLLTMQNYNELETMRILKKEATRLTSDPNYTPCPIQ